jgi:hypothetical protein
MKNIKAYSIQIAGAVTGAIGGYLYWRFVGCQSGGCAITSNPYMSILWGTAMGYLLFDAVAGFFKKKDSQEKTTSV